MTNATVYLNGAQIAAAPGWLSAVVGRAHAGLAAGDNVLAVVVDGRWLDVPPSGRPAAPGRSTTCSPAGIYRDVALRVVPEVFIADVFAKPANVLTASPASRCRSPSTRRPCPGAPVSVTARCWTATTQLASASRLGHADRHRQRRRRRSRSRHHRHHPVVAGHAEAVPGTSRRSWPTAVQHTRHGHHRFSGGNVPGRRLLPQRPAAADLRPQPPPAVPLYRDGRAGAPAAPRRRAAQERAQLQHGALLALSPVAALPRRLRRARPDGVGGAAGLAVHRRRRRVPQLVVENVHDMVVRDRNRPSVIIWATRLNETCE